MEMYQVEVYKPNAGEVFLEKIVFAENEDEAILSVQQELKAKKIEFGICMAQELDRKS